MLRISTPLNSNVIAIVSSKKQLAFYFGFAGLIGSIAGTLFLYWYFGRENIEQIDQSVNLALGLPNAKYLLAIPVAGTIFSVLWTLPFQPERFDDFDGAWVSLFAFLSVCACVSFFGGMYYILVNFLTFALLGFMLFGWVLVVLGLITGIIYKRNANLSTL